MTLFQHVSAWFSEVGEISDPMDQLTLEADFGKQKILRLLASRWPLVLAGWRWDLNQRIKKSNTTQSDNNMATMATQFIFYCSFVWCSFWDRSGQNGMDFLHGLLGSVAELQTYKFELKILWLTVAYSGDLCPQSNWLPELYSRTYPFQLNYDGLFVV